MMDKQFLYNQFFVLGLYDNFSMRFYFLGVLYRGVVTMFEIGYDNIGYGGIVRGEVDGFVMLLDIQLLY